MSEHKPETFLLDDTLYETRLTRKNALRKRWTPPDPGKIRAHIPGLILQVHVAPGQKVQTGAPLLILEAMKMQNDVRAPQAGTVTAVHIKNGDLVAKGQVMVELAP